MREMERGGFLQEPIWDPTSSDMNGAISGENAERIAEAVAGPTPLSVVSSDTAWARSGIAANAARDAASTSASPSASA